ncbi:hypothetical protein OAL01_01150 [Rubripirellula sp.]|nr:hypothetical protein [Rubripirellula sp.]
MFTHSDLIVNEWELFGMPNPDLQDDMEQLNSHSDEERWGFERTLNGEKQHEGWKEGWV